MAVVQSSYPPISLPHTQTLGDVLGSIGHTCSGICQDEARDLPVVWFVPRARINSSIGVVIVDTSTLNHESIVVSALMADVNSCTARDRIRVVARGGAMPTTSVNARQRRAALASLNGLPRLTLVDGATSSGAR